MIYLERDIYMSNNMSSFHMPSVNLLGSGSIIEAGAKLKELVAKKKLLVTDEDLHSLGLSEKIAQNNRQAGVEVFIYPKAEPNPTDKNVEDGLKAYQDENCDSITT